MRNARCYVATVKIMDKFETHTTVPVRAKEINVTDRAEMPVDLYETDAHVVIAAGMPRCLPNRIEIGVQGDTLFIAAEEHQGEQKLDAARTYHMRELPAGKIGRSIPLPTCNADSAIAHFNNGLLVITFDKAVSG